MDILASHCLIRNQWEQNSAITRPSKFIPCLKTVTTFLPLPGLYRHHLPLEAYGHVCLFAASLFRKQEMKTALKRLAVV